MSIQKSKPVRAPSKWQ